MSDRTAAAFFAWMLLILLVAGVAVVQQLRPHPGVAAGGTAAEGASQEQAVSELQGRLIEMQVDRAMLEARIKATAADVRAAEDAAAAQTSAAAKAPAQHEMKSKRVLTTDEIELRKPAKILDRKHRREHGLQTGILALARQQIHLQEALI